MRKYPFLITLREYLAKELGYEAPLALIMKDPDIIDITITRLSEALKKGVAPLENGRTIYDEVVSHHLALLLAGKLGARVAERIARAEAARAAKYLELEDTDSLIALTAELGLTVKRESISFPWVYDLRKRTYRSRVLPVAIRLDSYLKAVASSDEPQLRLTNAFLLRGWVYVDRKMLIEILKHAIYNTIKYRLHENTTLYSDEVSDELLTKAHKVATEILDQKEKGLTWSPEAFPPCITSLLAKASDRGLNSLSDEEGYLLTSFLALLGPNDNDLENLFRETGVSESKAVNAIINLIKLAKDKRTRIYTCKALKGLGICMASCGVATPIHAYRRSLRKLESNQ